MRRHPLKLLRVVLAVTVFAALGAALADFRDLVPASVGHRLASVQLVPALLGLATGAGGWLAVALLFGMSLAVGRVYCSAVCPLGILQDAVARLASLVPLRKRRPVPYARPLTWLRWAFLGVALAGIAAGWAGATLAVLDPYSNFGRIAADLFRPLATLANNSVVGIANAAGIRSLYRVEPAWAAAGALAFPVLMLALVSVLAAWRGRLYCNTVCPVGTALGVLGRFAAFRLAIERDACHKCAACLGACKAQCIDLRAGTIDASRCVGCFNCLGACDRHGIAYRFTWRRKPAPKPATEAATPDPARRAFLVGAAAAVGAAATSGLGARTSDGAGVAQPGGPISPPGAGDIERFLSRCTACHLCVSACPTHVLQPTVLDYGLAGLFVPHLDYTKAFCNYECNECGRVCPTGAISALALAEKQVAQIGIAGFHKDLCIVFAKGKDCAACAEHCPTKALRTVPYGDNLHLPEVTGELCIGCGACEFACPVQPQKAITVRSLRRHGHARKPVVEKAAAPVTSGDFPF